MGRVADRADHRVDGVVHLMQSHAESLALVRCEHSPILAAAAVSLATS
jgi:hypothetical protein